MRLMASILYVAALVVAPAMAEATVVHNTFGPNDSHSEVGGAVMTGSAVGYQAVANGFTVSGGAYQLSKLEVAVALQAGANSLVVKFMSDTAGLPGTVLEEFTLTDAMAGSYGSILSIDSVQHPLLADGSSYWVVLEAGGANTMAAWWANTVGAQEPFTWDSGSGWNAPYLGTTSAYRVTAITQLAPHPGDANNDGNVNVGDLGILAGNWGGAGKVWATGDFTNDGLVNVGDLGVLAGAWGWIGAPAGAGSLPEPASLVLLALGGLAMLRRRRVS